MKSVIFFKERGLNNLNQVTTHSVKSDIDFVKDQVNAKLRIKGAIGKFVSGPALCLIDTGNN